jgi:hypothetical protein
MLKPRECPKLTQSVSKTSSSLGDRASLTTRDQSHEHPAPGGIRTVAQPDQRYSANSVLSRAG